MKNIVIALILLSGITLLLVGGSGAVNNQRVDPELAINEKNMNFSSRLKDADTSNLETSKVTYTKVTSKQIEAPTDANSQEVKTGDSITVHYRGWLSKTGKVFDQSFNHGNTGFTFTVGRGVITGWSTGVLGMKNGEVRRLYIPSESGYGKAGNGEDIPPDSDLIFDVELISIN